MAKRARGRRTLLQRWIDQAPGMTQVQLAALCDIDQSLMSKYARGERRPGVDNAVAIDLATAGAVPAASWHATGRGARRPRPVAAEVAPAVVEETPRDTPADPAAS